jgi:hypothetical protein
MVVIGGIIGSGIFINPSCCRPAGQHGSRARRVGHGRAIALAGTFAYAELGALFPRVGPVRVPSATVFIHSPDSCADGRSWP